ncbi:hypothetical protein [Streptomyces sp. NPDC014894]|uniref:imidazolonepropionase-like domain-containing protein n=1 Tax=Streptomyces sp. NPDC014894 TaxID=3364931 RepID=UPI0036FAB9EA
MLTLHTADAVLAGVPGAAAVAVDTGRIAALGPYEELTAAYPTARVRRWPGLLTPGLRHPRAGELLEWAYHPDPREAAELGTEPVTGAALEALAPDGARWGGSARRGLQRLLAHGVTAVTGPFARPSVRIAVSRAGLRVRDAAPGAGPGSPDRPASLDPIAYAPPETLLDGPLAVGAPADFAVFAVPVDEPWPGALERLGAASCVATVLAGRLVHRRS